MWILNEEFSVCGNKRELMYGKDVINYIPGRFFSGKSSGCKGLPHFQIYLLVLDFLNTNTHYREVVQF